MRCLQLGDTLPGYLSSWIAKGSFKFLGKCNPGLDVSKIHVKARQPGARGMTMILGIEQDMETLIQASNSKVSFATDPIQLRLAKQHQRGK